MSSLLSRSCSPQHGPGLASAEVSKLLTQVQGWSLDAGGQGIHRTFKFASYYPTIAFVNAVAWIAHREDHHPDMTVGYNTVVVTYATHSVGGLSENDFICAAKVDALGTL